MRKVLVMLTGALALFGVLGAACGDDQKKTPATDTPAPATTAPAAGTTSDTGASGLRSALDALLQEHVYLAASATGAAIGGRTEEFDGAAAALDENSVALSGAIASVYGKEGGDAFLPLWRSHIDFFVDYTNGVATKDMAKQDKAVADLTQYTEDFGAFIESATEGGLPKAAVAELVLDHVLGLKAAVDMQAAGDAPGAYTALREAAGHMDMIAGALAGGIAVQFPDKFDGQADSAAAGLRSALNLALAEHVYLAASATGAALGGRTAEFDAAAAALDENSVALGDAITSVYGAGGGDQFLELWRSHIGFFVGYTNGVAMKDMAKQDKAVADLTQYTEDFGAFLDSATEGALAKDAVAGLVLDHVLGLKAVVDKQAATDPAGAYTSLREAAGHMSMVADPLAETIVQQFPEKFAAELGGHGDASVSAAGLICKIA